MEPLCKTIDEIDDFIAFLVLYCPNHFHPRHNLDLESAFEQLRLSIRACAGEFPSKETMTTVENMSEEALLSYRGGINKQGAHILQDIAQVLEGGKKSAL